MSRLVLALVATTLANVAAAQPQVPAGLTRREFDDGPAQTSAARALGQLAGRVTYASSVPLALPPALPLYADLRVGQLILEPYYAEGLCQRQRLWLYFEGPPAGDVIRIEKPHPPGSPAPTAPPPPELPTDPPKRAYRVEVTTEYLPLASDAARPSPQYATPVECASWPGWFVAPDASTARRALEIMSAVRSGGLGKAAVIESCYTDGARCNDAAAAVARGAQGQLFEVTVNHSKAEGVILSGQGKDGRVWNLNARQTERGRLILTYSASIPIPDSFPGLLRPPGD